LLSKKRQDIKKDGQVSTSRMQGMWTNALENYTRNLRVSDFRNMLIFTLFYSACYQRHFKKKKKAVIELSSGDEDDVMEMKPKLEEMKPCCSSSLKD
jgi:hypothetical protein